MSGFNEITRWSNLSRLAGGRLPKLTIIAPFVAFIILHNEPLQPFLEMSDNRHPNLAVEKLALARFDIFYLGLVIVGSAVSIFTLFSPSQVTSQGGYDGFIEFKERTKTNNGVSGSLRLTLEEFAKYSKRTELELDVRERRHRFPRRFREGLWSLLRALSGAVGDSGKTATLEHRSDPKIILLGLLADDLEMTETWDKFYSVLPDHSIDVFRLEFIRADYSSPITRGVIFWLMILGIFVVLVPTLITTFLVISDLIRVTTEVPMPS